jgi:hypothetical protein
MYAELAVIGFVSDDRNRMDALHSSGDDVETKLTISTYFDMLFVGSIYFVSVLSLQVAQSLLVWKDISFSLLLEL